MTASSTEKGIGKRAKRSLKWTLVGTIGTNLVRLVVIPILGRLLTPEQFGTVAAAVTVIAFGQMLRDIGIAAALVQRQTLDQHHVDAAIGWSNVLGVVVGGATFLTAPLVSRLFSITELTSMVQVLSAIFVIRSVGSVSRALCERELRFRALSIVDFGSFSIGSISAVLFAWLGFGPWSLIGGYLIETFLATALVFYLRPTKIHFRLSYASVRELLGFGAGATLADIAQYFANFGDYLVVGAQLGKQPLGLYTRAYELMRFPAAVFTNVATYPLFSAFSRWQLDRERLGRAYRRGTFATAILLLPISAGLIVSAPEMIHVLLGEGWEGAVLPFQVLSFSMMARTSWKLGGTLARATGDVYAVALANVAYAVLIVVGSTVGARWGMVGVSIAVSIECTLHYLVYSYLGLRRTDLSWSRFARLHGEGLVATALALAFIAPTVMLLRTASALEVVVVAGAITSGALSLLASALIGRLRGQQDWCWLLDAVLASLRRSAAARSRDQAAGVAPEVEQRVDNGQVRKEPELGE